MEIQKHIESKLQEFLTHIWNARSASDVKQIDGPDAWTQHIAHQNTTVVSPASVTPASHDDDGECEANKRGPHTITSQYPIHCAATKCSVVVFSPTITNAPTFSHSEGANWQGQFERLFERI